MPQFFALKNASLVVASRERERERERQKLSLLLSALQWTVFANLSERKNRRTAIKITDTQFRQNIAATATNCLSKIFTPRMTIEIKRLDDDQGDSIHYCFYFCHFYISKTRKRILSSSQSYTQTLIYTTSN